MTTTERRRPWTVSQVRAWTVSRVEHEGDVAIRIDAGGTSEIVNDRDPINGRFTAPDGYWMEQMEFAGKPLSANAVKYLSEQVLGIVIAVQHEEQSAGEAAVALLVAAGAAVTPNRSGYGWRVDYQGGRYTLWGCVGDAKNKVAGTTQPNEQGRWVETTAEALVAQAGAS